MSFRIIVITALSLAATAASAATIGFEGTTAGVFTGSLTESGYTYGAASGFLYANFFGNPGHDMEGFGAGNGGVLDIVSSSAGKFRLSGFDYAAVSDAGTGSQTLTLTGYRAGVAVGSASYTLGNVALPPYANWTTEAAGALAGVVIDDLKFTLNGTPGSPYSYEAVDNVVLSAAGSVPEPATWATMIVGMGTIAVAMRRRRENCPVAA